MLTTVSSGAKAVHAQAAGADHAINYKIDDVSDAVREFTDGRGVDQIIEMELGENKRGFDAMVDVRLATLAVLGVVDGGGAEKSPLD